MKIKFCLFETTTKGNCRIIGEVDGPHLNDFSVPEVGDKRIINGREFVVSSVDYPEFLEVNLYPSGDPESDEILAKKRQGLNE